MNEEERHQSLASLLPHHRLRAYGTALELLRAVRAAQIRDRMLRDLGGSWRFGGSSSYAPVCEALTSPRVEPSRMELQQRAAWACTSAERDAPFFLL